MSTTTYTIGPHSAVFSLLKFEHTSKNEKKKKKEKKYHTDCSDIWSLLHATIIYNVYWIRGAGSKHTTALFSRAMG